MSESRLIELEIRYAHLEDFVHKLNQTVLEQEKTIESLKKKMLDMERTTNAYPGEERLLKNEKPPHY
jgi:uncharacterized coiled-coil protein SlyX